jgi:hypothetical protein
MRRFAQNRWWTFILMLSVLLAGSATISSPSYGLTGPGKIQVGDGGGGGSDSGDPDSPTGGSRRTGYGRAVPSASPATVTTVGDGSPVTSIWTWRLHVVLRTLMSRYLR